MLNRINRLKKRYQFNYVYKSGEHFSGEHMVLYVVSSKTKNIKVGLAVTKKVGHAVVRNKIRRRLREIIKKQVPNLKQNNNIIVVARDNISSASFEKLSNEFLKLIKKADLINEESI
ncbi:MAG: ribonuclease P protein component [Clostridia bacterium]|nr:ribonuclease P protein component [Clostridia bacterium]MBR3884842.1 ribonuclease P protein component [Clostridia bacterium]